MAATGGNDLDKQEFLKFGEAFQRAAAELELTVSIQHMARPN
jgi:hypothetical protein